jgi:methyl-accepting chemotaxis protein
MDDARTEARRRDAELRDAQVAALNTASESLSQTLASLRDDAQNVQRRVSQVGEDIAPALASQVEALAAELSEPWRRQLAHIEKLHERLEAMLRESQRKISPSRTRRLFWRS